MIIIRNKDQVINLSLAREMHNSASKSERCLVANIDKVRYLIKDFDLDELISNTAGGTHSNMVVIYKEWAILN